MVMGNQELSGKWQSERRYSLVMPTYGVVKSQERTGRYLLILDASLSQGITLESGLGLKEHVSLRPFGALR